MSETKDPHKPKFDIATRAQAMTLRHCGYSFKNIEQQTGIAERQLQHIIRTAKKHGYDSEKSFRLEDCHFPDGHKTGRPRKFTEEQALELLAAAQPHEDGTKKTNATLAKEFGVSERTVRRRRVQLEEEHGKPEKKKSRPRPKPQPRPVPAPIDQRQQQQQQQQQQNRIEGNIAPQAHMHGSLQQQQPLSQVQQHNQQHQSQSFDSIQSTATPATTDGGEEHNFEARLIEQLQQEQQQQQHHQPEIGMYQYPPPSYHNPVPLGHPSHSLSPGGQHGGQ